MKLCLQIFHVQFRCMTSKLSSDDKTVAVAGKLSIVTMTNVYLSTVTVGKTKNNLYLGVNSFENTLFSGCGYIYVWVKPFPLALHANACMHSLQLIIT